MKRKYKKFLSNAKKSQAYWEGLLSLELTEDIWRIMKKKGISQKKLSNLLGTSEAYVSKLLNGNENLSIKSICKLALALDSAPHIHIAPTDVIVEWKERISSENRIEVLQPNAMDDFFDYRIEVENEPITFSVTRTSSYESEYPPEIHEGWMANINQDTPVRIN